LVSSPPVSFAISHIVRTLTIVEIFCFLILSPPGWSPGSIPTSFS
jgi:hypothetical protein